MVVLQEATYLPAIMQRRKQVEGRCKVCKHRTQDLAAPVDTDYIISVDPSRGYDQTLQEVFAADLQKNGLLCPHGRCKAREGFVKQARYLQWPLSLMMFFPTAAGMPMAFCVDCVVVSQWIC